jgi:5'-3' exonuclease
MSPADDMRKSQVSLNYLEGLEWTFKYYTTGCPDWRWSYQHHYPPLLEDLCKYVPIFEKTLVPLKPKNPVNPLTQLCYVLPSSSMTLLPPKLHHLLITEKPEWYAKKPQFVWAYCKYFWESHAVLSDIDIDELEEVLSKQS